MLWPFLLVPLATALTNLINGDGSKFEYPPNQFEQIRLVPDFIWRPFWFGEAGTWAFQSFTISNTRPFSIQVVDCFCAGDSFILYDNGNLIGPVDQLCTPNDDTCQAYQSDPNVCVQANANWCRKVFDFSIGHHNFTLYVSASPFEYGQGFLLPYTRIE